MVSGDPFLGFFGGVPGACLWIFGILKCELILNSILLTFRAADVAMLSPSWNHVEGKLRLFLCQNYVI